jgi:sugar phosphate isomerase/epimerase
MFTLSGFGDEISADLDEQLDTLKGLGVNYLEVRGAWGKSVLDFDDRELARLKQALASRQMRVSSIGSPIGKVPIDSPFAPHLEDFRRILGMAEYLESKYVRIFSFYGTTEEPERWRSEVLRRLEAFVRAAEASPVIVLHENESNIYGDIPQRCADILRSVGSPRFLAVWDAANFVQVGVDRPFDIGWPLLADYVVYVHVKDALRGTGEVVPAGEGDGQVRELLAALAPRQEEVFLSLEPHLVFAGQWAGFSGAELFGRAHAALTHLLAEV